MNNFRIHNVYRFVYLILLAQFFIADIKAQSLIKKFIQLPCAEKRWVIGHLFIAKSVLKLSEEAILVTNSLLADSTLDGDMSGGQLDAFRHAYWMALITQKHGVKKAMSLGKAHEKGNYQYFKRNKNEDGVLPDYESSQMDFLNNDIGIEIGKNFKMENKTVLKELIIIYIKVGKLFVLYKNKMNMYLDCNRNIITNNQKTWYSGKCIVPSNYKKE